MYTSPSENCFTIRLIHRNCIFATDIHADLCDTLQSNFLHCFVENFSCFFCCISFLFCCFFSQFLKFESEFLLFSENSNFSEYFSNTKSCAIFHAFSLSDVNFSFFHTDLHCSESLSSHSILFMSSFNFFHGSLPGPTLLFLGFFEKNPLSLPLKCI